MRAFLVYQVGIANVFEVDCHNLANYGREARRVYQGSFKGAELFSLGLAHAGVIVRTAACNMAGDIQTQRWTENLDDQPFSDKFAPVHAN